MKPVQLDGLPVTSASRPVDGPTAPPDNRKWRTPSTLEPMPHQGALQDGDAVAIRFPEGWRIAKRWRRERGGILCVLEEGGSIWVDQCRAVMMLHLEDQK